MKYILVYVLLFVAASLPAQEPTPRARAQENVQRRVTQEPADPFLSNIAVSDSGVQRLIVLLGELEMQLSAENPGKGGVAVQASNLNLSKSNVNRAKSNAINVSTALDKLKNCTPEERRASLATLHKTAAELDAAVLELNKSLAGLGRGYAAKAAEMKTKHDTVKNSINNIR